MNLSTPPTSPTIRFTAISRSSSGAGLPAGEVSERQIIDHPWVQRLRHIHQLQTAWWVYPSAEHTRFPARHRRHAPGQPGRRPALSQPEGIVPRRSRAAATSRRCCGWRACCTTWGTGRSATSSTSIFSTGHGLTHETLGRPSSSASDLGDLLRRVRRNPNSALEAGRNARSRADRLAHPAAQDGDADSQPRWLVLAPLRCSRGIYTIDNMDFVLRDAYMTGYSQRAFDLDRLLHYSFFSPHGLTIHDRGADALVRFIGVRAELFRSVYFHRTVRAIDLALKDLFAASKDWLFPGNPLERLDDYLRFHRVVAAGRYAAVGRHRPTRRSASSASVGGTSSPAGAVGHGLPAEPGVRQGRLRAGQHFQRRRRWSSTSCGSSCRATSLRLPLRVDIARTIFRPHTAGPAAGQNFLFDSAKGRVQPLTAHEFFRRLPISHRLCRVYAHTTEHAPQIAAALDSMLGGAVDDVTNM